MERLTVKQVQAEALKIIRSHPGGIRFTTLVTAIVESHPETPRNTVNGSVWNLHTLRPDEVRKPSRGLFQPAQATQEIEEPRGPYVVCVSDGGYRVSLVVRRLYRTIPDEVARRRGLLRVVDESGEDYLFPKELFASIDVSQSLGRKLALAT